MEEGKRSRPRSAMFKRDPDEAMQDIKRFLKSWTEATNTLLQEIRELSNNLKKR